MIAILGGTGKIGRETLNAMHLLEPETEIIIGSRHRPTDGEASSYTWKFFDVNDIESIDALLDGVSVVINAAGPSSVVSAPIMDATRARGIPLVDVGDSECYRKYEAEENSLGEKTNNSLVMSGCGSIPGLIGVLPIILSRDFIQISELEVNYRIDEEISMSAATDMAAKMNASSTSEINATTFTKPENIPLLGEAVYRYPYHDEECEAVEHIINPIKSTWNMVRPDTEYEKLLASPYKDREELAARISKMSKFAIKDIRPGIHFYVKIQGILRENQKDGVRVLYASCGNPAEVSGKVLAATSSAVYRTSCDYELNGYYRPATFPMIDLLLENINKLGVFESWNIYPYLFDTDTEEVGEL